VAFKRRGGRFGARPRSRRVGQYRSQLEAKIAAELTAAGVPVEHETLRVPYIDTRSKYYLTDFILPNGIVIESKGYFVSSDRAKHRMLKEQHPSLDLRFVFAKPHNRISKQSTTTYAVWANTHGFKWATLSVPQSWIDEPRNLESLKAIRQIKEAK